jgi:hypothetical protein
VGVGSDNTQLIAPCGINCRVCLAFMREKNKCPGCRVVDMAKCETRVRCVIKNCEHVKAGKTGYCYDCDRLPCRRMKSLDKRYRAKYGTSVLENLKYMQEHGARAFVNRENKRWICPACGAMLCMHRENCPACGRKWHEAGIVF